MSIRKKILYYFSVVAIAFIGIAFIFIYTLFNSFREEEFHQLQKETITSIVDVLNDETQSNNDSIQSQDIYTGHGIYDEKVWIYNENKHLIYSNTDDSLNIQKIFLERLSKSKKEINAKDGQSDIIGMRIESEKNYYGINLAYDSLGYSKLNYLKYVLLFTFLGISVIIIGISYYLAKKISSSIVDIARQVNNYDVGTGFNPIITSEKENEVAVLADRFNELMKRTSEAFSFQRHAIHHISHELKTPIAILVSNFERMEDETDIVQIKKSINNQKENTKNLSEIINSLLEIAKIESGTNFSRSKMRIDELIFDLVDELSILHPTFCFSVEYKQTMDDENALTLSVNHRLLKIALMNLMVNCIQYSDDNKAGILIIGRPDGLQLEFNNNGDIIIEREKQYIFQHFFRGENSKGKRGFGLGLVFVHKIIALHNGSVTYSNNNLTTNTFSVFLPLK